MDIEEACRVLHVPPEEATRESVRAAYKKLALRHHPDKNPGHEDEAKAAFQRLSAAYSATEGHFDSRGRRVHTERDDFWSSTTASSTADANTDANASFSWDAARDVFREAFGMEFEDAAREAVNTVASMIEASAPNSQRCMSEQRVSNSIAIQNCKETISRTEQSLNEARDAHRETMHRYEAFLREPQIYSGIGKALVWSVVATGILCGEVAPLVEHLSLVFVAIVLCGFTIGFMKLGGFLSYLGRKGSLAAKVDNAESTVRRAEAELATARSSLAEAANPINQGLSIAGAALLGFVQTQIEQSNAWPQG